ncbi:hypothetical protein PAMP_004301 [Pampus punctatissimus]
MDHIIDISWSDRSFYFVDDDLLEEKSPGGHCLAQRGQQTFNRSNISKAASCLGSQCLFAFYGGETSYHRHLFLLQLSNLLIFLWLVNFSLAVEQCTLAGTFSSYYWAKRKPQDIPPCPLFSSFSRAIRLQSMVRAFVLQPGKPSSC